MKKTLKIGLVILIVGLVMLAIGWCNHGNRSVVFNGSGKPILVNKHPSRFVVKQSFNQVQGTVATANVEIRQGTKSSITYIGTNRPTISVKNGVAKIQQRHQRHTMGFYINTPATADKIIITVPADQQLTGKLDLHDGDLAVTSVTLQQLAVKLISGDADYSNVTVNGGSLRLTDGDWLADHLTVNGHYQVKNQDGDNEVRGLQTDGYKLYTSDGDNEIHGHDHDADTVVDNDQASNVLYLWNRDGDNILH